jgi:very-short-patch-repair endonuclease
MNYFKQIARTLRKNMTEAEVMLWQRIRRKQIDDQQFYRQKQLGKYIVDFYCPEKKLVIEVDGGQHYDMGEIVTKDEERENYLKNILKLKVIRFTNTKVMKNISSVIDKIIESL